MHDHSPAGARHPHVCHRHPAGPPLLQKHMTSAACSPANPPFQFGEYCPDGAAGMWQQAAQQPQLAFVPTAADYAACEPVLAASYPVAAGWQQQGQAYPGYLPIMPGAPQPIAPDAQQAADALGKRQVPATPGPATYSLAGCMHACPSRSACRPPSHQLGCLLPSRLVLCSRPYQPTLLPCPLCRRQEAAALVGGAPCALC